MVKNLSASARVVRDVGSISGSGIYPGGGHDKPLQYSCLENPMDGGAWWITAHGITKSQKKLKRQQAGTLKLFSDLEGTDSFTILKLLIREHLHLL